MEFCILSVNSRHNVVRWLSRDTCTIYWQLNIDWKPSVEVAPTAWATFSRQLQRVGLFCGKNVFPKHDDLFPCLVPELTHAGLLHHMRHIAYHQLFNAKVKQTSNYKKRKITVNTFNFSCFISVSHFFCNLSLKCLLLADVATRLHVLRIEL